MRPDPSIWNHPAFTCLWQYATKGCPVDCGPTWSRDHLAAMAQRGPHKSATSPEAIQCLREETMEKVEQGLARIVLWDDIKDAPHPNLKISPIAAVPHKSRPFRSILDLSFQLRVNGLTMPSVNETTTPLSNHKSMEQMGRVLWRIVSTVAYVNPKNGHLVFAKWDIKDGFWRLVVSDEDAWNFCFVLPRLNENDPIELVVSNCLSMGWCESPPLFCTAGETARDAAQDLCDNPAELPPHDLESYSWPTDLALPAPGTREAEHLLKLLESYMDDFMGVLQAPTPEEMIHFTRAVLHGINKVFPAPGPTDDPKDNPIAIKKLQQGDGRWSTSKEILGWFFDGITRCMSLPSTKVTKIMSILRSLSRKPIVRLGDLESLNGKLMHATIGIPNGKGLLSPIITTVTKHARGKHYKNKTLRLNQTTRQALQDWLTLLPAALRNPIPCTDLMPAPADFVGYCDASKNGAGGIWFGLNKDLPPIVWRIPFPERIQQQVISQNNPHGKISNSDLEMIGLLFQWLVLEKFVDLAHAHVAIWCDNTPTVAWATKLLATKARTAARILRILALRMISCRASPLTTMHIPGNNNNMADFASRSFNVCHTSKTFLTEFHKRFPLPQDASWVLCQLPNATIGHALSCLSMPTPSVASWRRLSQRASVTGGTGAHYFPPVSIHTFKGWIQQKNLHSYKFLLDESGKVQPAQDAKSNLVACRQPSAPSERPLNWMGAETHFTNQEPPTIMLDLRHK